MHVQINGGIVFWKVNIKLTKDLFFDWYGIKNELEIGMAFEVPKITHK